jgi:hypothetical protein
MSETDNEPVSSNDIGLESTPNDLSELDALLDAAGVVDVPEEEAQSKAKDEEEEDKPAPEETPAQATPEPAKESSSEEPPATEESLPLADTAGLKDVETPQPAAEGETEEATPVEEPDEEVDSIQKPINLSPTNSQNWANLRQKAKERGKKLKEIEGELQQLRAQATSQTLPEETKQELEELRSFRRTFDIQNDPEFRQKYDGAIEANRQRAYELLAKHQMSEENLNLIKDKGFENLDQEFFEEQIYKPLMKGTLEERKDAMALKKAMESNLSLMVDKDQAIQEASKQGSQWQQQRDQDARQRFEEFNKVVEARVADVQQKIPWAKEQPVPPTATEEQRAQIEKNNQFYKKYVEPTFTKAMFDPSPQARVDTAMAAVLAFKYSDELANLTQKHNRLVEEYNKIRAAGRTKSSTPAAQPAKKKASVSDYIAMSDDEAIDAQMKELGL